MSARKPVLPEVQWLVDVHTGPTRNAAHAELRAAEAVIRAARRVDLCARNFWTDRNEGIKATAALAKSITRLDALRGTR